MTLMVQVSSDTSSSNTRLVLAFPKDAYEMVFCITVFCITASCDVLGCAAHPHTRVTQPVTSLEKSIRIVHGHVDPESGW
ncbi:hypothetical protein CA13_58000 [Planctomycetes bacterium CA13]|uniref:Uncharacterized protein n=1 Tax=Novipirellula herctigrandis TaxID=2527986 RepID=A0A5C5ZCL7_9BACT|nr:hypothetical protein CA13_58000 [Planctomycetes bacterium CA13]